MNTNYANEIESACQTLWRAKVAHEKAMNTIAEKIAAEAGIVYDSILMTGPKSTGRVCGFQYNQKAEVGKEPINVMVYTFPNVYRTISLDQAVEMKAAYEAALAKTVTKGETHE